VKRFPDRPALSARGQSRVDSLTYRDLDGLTQRAATFLSQQGLKRGERCAIFAENSAASVAAYLGILRIGAVAVPFDPASPAGQTASQLLDCGARMLLTSARLEAAARTGAATAACALATLDEAMSVAEQPLPQCPAAREDTAVILYTSGTTADPKGVALTHGNLLAERDAVIGAVGMSEHDAILGALPLVHPLAQIASLLPLSIGAHVVFLDPGSAGDLMHALDERTITIVVCVPQFLELLHQRDGVGTQTRGIAARTLLSLLRRARRLVADGTPERRRRVIITGGSKLEPATGRRWRDLGFTIQQTYALAETSGAATLTRPGEATDTLGAPLPGLEIRVHDDEILVRGATVMQGYWNRPDATANAFRDGWLRTGDIGRLDEHGRLTIAGRIKEVIGLASGENIYPEEIEAHYRQSLFIKELCVVGAAAPGASAPERLHAIVVPDVGVLRQRKIVNVAELIRFEMEGLSLALPSFKRVTGFDIVMTPLPRTTTGNLKRHEIAGIDPAGRAVAAARVAPEVIDDVHVARIVSLIGRHVRPGVAVTARSNLELDLGLDSLDRVELLAALEQRLGVRVSEDAAASAFLVSDLAEALRGAKEVSDTSELPWKTMLDVKAPPPQLRSLLARRTYTALALFALTRVLVWTLTRPKVEGLEHLPERGPFIITPNHQSYIDPFILMGVLPFRTLRDLFFVGAAEYFQAAITAWLAGKMNIVPVDPDANLVPAMQAGAFGLLHGKVLVLFPEGERSIDGGVKKFKKGAAILSHHRGAPIVPVAMSGIFEIWPRNRPLTWRLLLPWSGHHARVRFGPPLRPDQSSYAEKTSRLRSAVDQMWQSIAPRRYDRLEHGAADTGSGKLRT
jgi:long-chain acyl-CoA synthetase